MAVGVFATNTLAAIIAAAEVAPAAGAAAHRCHVCVSVATALAAGVLLPPLALAACECRTSAADQDRRVDFAVELAKETFTSCDAGAPVAMTVKRFLTAAQVATALADSHKVQQDQEQQVCIAECLFSSAFVFLSRICFWL